MTYGLPYQGSKNSIAEKLVDNLPNGETFVDVFFGGGAITHCALLKNKYNNYILNDIRGTPKFFLDCVHGKYSNDLKWVCREDFKKSSEDNLFVRCCYSFGNDFRSYLYSPVIEKKKKRYITRFVSMIIPC